MVTGSHMKLGDLPRLELEASEQSFVDIPAMKAGYIRAKNEKAKCRGIKCSLQFAP